MSMMILGPSKDQDNAQKPEEKKKYPFSKMLLIILICSLVKEFSPINSM